MITNTANKIFKFIKDKKQVPAKDIVQHIGFSKQVVFRHLARLLDDGRISKIGKVPKVFYIVKEQEKEEEEYNLNVDTKKIIENNFLTVTSGGEMKKGLDGFIVWCQKRKQDVEKSAIQYVSIIKKYNSIRKNGLLDGMKKMRTTFDKVYLDSLFYIDFYAIEHFGKTKIGQTLLYAKQSQDRVMIKDLTEDIKPKIKQIIKQYKIDAIGFVPPTVKREVQLMRELEKNLNFKINKVKITKIKTQVVVPQKTLNKLEDRIENAQKTFVVEEQPIYKNILLIDDAVGSGATLNEIAKKIKAKKIVKNKIIGLVITGSLKDFDVISEV